MTKSLLAQASKLSVSERIELVEAIWDTVGPEADAMPLPESHRAELERRLADLDANPDAGSSWEEVRARLSQFPRVDIREMIAAVFRPTIILRRRR